MKHFGPKFLKVEDVMTDYNNSVVEKTHFVLPNKPEITDDNYKAIPGQMISLLMILGLDGLAFLHKVLVESHDYEIISSEDKWDTYCLCDGFGELTSKELKKINDGWDWSHIRDSSPEVLNRALVHAKSKLIELYNRH